MGQQGLQCTETTLHPLKPPCPPWHNHLPPFCATQSNTDDTSWTLKTKHLLVDFHSRPFPRTETGEQNGPFPKTKLLDPLTSLKTLFHLVMSTDALQPAPRTRHPRQPLPEHT